VTDNSPGGEDGRSHYPLAASPAVADEALRDRRAAITGLGDALRDLVQAAAATEVPADVLRAVTAQVRAAAAPLRQRSRTRGQPPGADDLLAGFRMYNPVTGSGSPLAPPLRIEIADGMVAGTCTLGLAYEGPPACVHGGVSAMLLDQLLGYAASAAGRPGMTVALDMRYRAPVPLQTELRVTAAVGEVTGRRVTVLGAITTAADPGTVLVEATGTFVVLRAEQAARLFGGAGPGTADPAVAHD